MKNNEQAPDNDESCLFCKIGRGVISSTFVHEDQNCFAIRDITPQAPTHILVIPKKHYKNIVLVDDKLLMGELFQQAASIAAKENLENGFRLVINTGADGGQSVGHLHIHILGGRSMQWPPG
ncbi:MAG: histidine triad nucleotide-binding protein [Candidatus Obscuribacterales bacterium]